MRYAFIDSSPKPDDQLDTTPIRPAKKHRTENDIAMNVGDNDQIIGDDEKAEANARGVSRRGCLKTHKRRSEFTNIQEAVDWTIKHKTYPVCREFGQDTLKRFDFLDHVGRHARIRG